jgi:peptide/nickel transport system substrate-binding protein
VIATEPETLDPRFVVDAASMRVTRLVHAGLFRLDPDTLEPVDYVAASHRFEDPLTLDVTLREDVRFHSGAPVRAADVVATIEALKDPALHAREAHAVAAIERAEAVSEHEVRIRLAHPHATLLTDLEVPVLRADQARSAPQQDGGTDLDGLGPYRVARVRPGAIDLDPVEHSPLPKPAHPVHVRVVHDENARALRLIGGETDVAPSGIAPALLPTFEQRGLRVASRPGANLVYVLFRDDHGPFADADARRAFGLAIDRDAIVTHMLGGRARLATGLIPPGHWAATLRPPMTRDAAKAREMLHGKHVHCTLLGSTDRLRVSIARVAAQELAEVGIDAEVVPLELGTLLSRLSAGDFDAAILQIPELTEPNVLRVFLHSKWMPPNGANRARVDDAEVDAAIDEGASTLDLAARRAAYARLEARVLDRAFWIPLWHEDQFAVTSARASSFVLSAEGRWLGLASVP